MKWSSAGRLAYRAKLDGPGNANELYLYTPGADDPGPFAVGGTSGTTPQGQILNFDWSPDGRHIAFSTVTVGIQDLFSTPADATGGGERNELHDEISTGIEFDWLADSSRVVLTESNAGSINMFSNKPAGDDLVSLVDLLGDAGTGVQHFAISP